VSAGGGKVLLDTCALIWLANGSKLSPAALAALQHAAGIGGVFVSPISAWEIGMLCRPRGGRPAQIECIPNPLAWFERAQRIFALRIAPLSPAIAVAASMLPGDPHADPADRLIIATARDLSLAIVTRDSRIAEYAGQGHVSVVGC
jgi:PIN domain nuclease of toxin-antitoxin system